MPAGAGAERRVPEEAHVEHRLVDVQLPEHEEREARCRDARTRSTCLGAPPPVVGRLDQAVDERRDPDDREDRAERVEAALLGVARLRHEEPARRRARAAMIGTFTRNTEPYQKWPSSQPLATGPIAPAAPAVGGPDRDRLRALVGREHVHEDRQRRRHDQRGRRAHQRRGTRSAATSRATPTRAPSHEEADEPELQRALAAEAVAERAGRRTAGRRTRASRRRRPTAAATSVACELARERRDRDVEARVADEDDEQAQAEDDERPPAPGVRSSAVIAGDIGRCIMA